MDQALFPLIEFLLPAWNASPPTPCDPHHVGGLDPLGLAETYAPTCPPLSGGVVDPPPGLVSFFFFFSLGLASIRYVHVRIELAPDGHDLALERRRKRPQTTEVHDVAVGYDFARHISGEVQDALHFHVIEGRVLGYQFAKALEAHTMATPRRGLDDHLAFVGPDAYLALAEGVTNGFVFLTHNYLRCLQLVFRAPVGDVIQGQGKVCFSSSESLSA